MVLAEKLLNSAPHWAVYYTVLLHQKLSTFQGPSFYFALVAVAVPFLHCLFLSWLLRWFDVDVMNFCYSLVRCTFVSAFVYLFQDL